MRKAFLLIAIFLSWGWNIKTSTGQSYGNEWIEFSQEYYHIKIAEDGIYHISYNDLLNAGALENNPNPVNFQLFHRGQEVAIRVSGQNDFSFDPGDFIEFYGIRNDGTGDRPLYKEDAQPHSYYNLYSDSSSYFLTWNFSGIRGKRIQNFTETTNVDNLPAESHHMDKILELKTSEFSNGLVYGAETRDAAFDFGEGWTGKAFSKGQTIRDTLRNITQRFEAGQPPELTILFAGRNIQPHRLIIQAGPSGNNLRTLDTLEFENYYTQNFSAVLNWTDISSSGELYLAINIDGPQTADRVSMSYILLEFPQALHTSGNPVKLFHLPQNAGNTSYIEIQGINSPDILWDITDIYNPVNIVYPTAGAVLQTLIPNTSISRTLFYSESGALSISSIDKIEFQEIDPSSFNYLIVYHRDFTTPGGNYQNPVESYAEYRSNRFVPLTIDIEQLINQFNYGEISPLAIRNFCRFMIDGGNPEYLLLIGKGLLVRFNYYRFPDNPSLQGNKDWIPTAGNPGSDNLHTANINGSGQSPALPTGRIPAQSSDDVAAYLDKVMEMEMLDFDELWRKEVVQLSGGITTGEKTLFKNYIDQFQNQLEGPFFGGNTINIFKESTDEVEFINISEEINKGKNMVLFFGHSSIGISDIDIGKVTDPGLGYNNLGKYPLIFMNGCDAGNIFTPEISLGENWINTAEKGAIAWSAHADVGLRSQLKLFTDKFLDTGYEDSVYISKPLGNILQETNRRFLSLFDPASEINIAQVQQTVFQGDPALSLFNVNLADYSISPENITASTTTGDLITSVTDSFQVRIIIQNFGKVNTDSLEILIKRTYPDDGNQPGEEILGPYSVPPVYFQDTLFFTIYNNRLPFSGENTFEITIDPENRIPEISTINNSASYVLDIPDLGTNNLLPYEYSIVNTDTFSLLTQSNNFVNVTRQYIFEIDSTPDYNSPVRESFSIPEKWLAEWIKSVPDGITPDDTVTFFWRTRFSESLPGEDTIWSQFSFSYIPDGPEGWAQTSDHQIRENLINGMNYDQSNRTWEFDRISNTLEVITFGSDHPDFSAEDVSVRYNESELIIDPLYCSDNSINALAFRRISALPYLMFDYNVLQRRSCGRQPQLINNFLNTEIEGDPEYNLSLYIDQLSDGDPVLLFSIGQVDYSNWSDALKIKLTEIGIESNILNELSDGEPMIILGKKGDPPGSAMFVHADAGSTIPLTEQTIILEGNIFRTSTSASIRSKRIGPAVTWGSFYNRVLPPEMPGDEFYSFSIEGIKGDNSRDVLFDNIQADFLDISTVNPQIYPYLELIFTSTDTTNLRPAHLDFWIVSYEPFAEGVLLPADNQDLENIKKQEGEPFQAGFVFKNIGNRSFSSDTLLSGYSLINQSSSKSSPDSIYINSPSPGQSTDFVVDINSIGFQGKNDFTISVNPGLVPEIYFRNNFLRLPDFADIQSDLIQPVIDVAFDGRYILDGEIVSPSPLISIKLKDENEYIFKEDTTGINILLAYPDEEAARRISFSDPALTWSPASENNDFSIEYKPENLPDGIYRLEVQAEDASGNESGAEPYEIHFEVINESQITHFYPFPNPFSTSTRFVFTLTGSVIPEEIKIQIMTVSGRVVREILQDEIGPIHIGNNITEYAWDGRDEYGDQLANGVYLYRVIINNPGDSFKHRQTGGDAGFTKDFGKIYLLR